MPNVTHPIESSRLTEDWEQTRRWIESETGMNLSGSRFGRLRDAVGKSLGQQDPETALRGILARPDQQVQFLEKLTTQLTIGESFYFRNEHHFKVLREIVLPQILAENKTRRDVRIWSAGCATGEEPYSLAILLDQLLVGHLGWHVSILGTDLNPEFLQRAREGCYRQWSFRQTQIHQNREYFTPQGDSFCLIKAIRDRVRFAYLNLVKDVYPSPLTGTVGLDLIVFRNVAIYLKPEVTAAILRRFYQALRPGGWLLLGETEVTGTSPGEFEVHRFDQATFYQKTTTRPSLVQDEADATLPPARAGVATSTSVRIPSVPAIPEWVPLPRRRESEALSMSSSSGVSSESLAREQIDRALAGGRFDEAQRVVERVPVVKTRALLRLRLVESLLASAEVTRARRMLDLCLADEPMLLEAQLLKAGLAEESGDLATAEKSYRRALYINPHAAIAHFHLALVLDQKGDRPAVARSLKTTLKLIDGKDPHSLVEFGEGVCHGRLKEMVSLLMSK